MNWLGLVFGVAIGLYGQHAFAKDRLTAPLKIARECKSDLELRCKGVRPGRQRIVSCLKDKVSELTPACLAALKATE